MNKQPNFVFICTDQQRSDSLGCTGNSHSKTPNIDSIAMSGIRFRRHSTPMQICSPSRATMLTGLYPRHHRLATNGMALPEDVPVVTRLLEAKGYRTHGIGKQHLQPLLAPSEKFMPDSRAFWNLPQSKVWNGPFYGYQSIDLLLGESDTAHLAGHYANWLRTHFPESVELLKPSSACEPPPPDLDEIWRSAIPPQHHYNTWIGDCAVSFLDQQSTSRSPFFLFVSFPDPHHPFDPPIHYANQFNSDEMPIPRASSSELSKQLPYFDELYPKGEGFRELYWAAREDLEAGSMISTRSISDQSLQMVIAYTYASIAMIDDQVGRILNKLNDLEIMDRTVVMFTSDHGELLGDHDLLHKGPPPYRQLTEVCFLMQGPGISQGKCVEALTNHVDLAPTVLDLAGISIEQFPCDGISLSPMLEDEMNSLRDYDFGEYHPTCRTDVYNQTVRTKQWRFTLYPNRPEWGELYCLDEDPCERLNRFGDQDTRNIQNHLKAVLNEKFPPHPFVDNECLCKW